MRTFLKILTHSLNIYKQFSFFFFLFFNLKKQTNEQMEPINLSKNIPREVRLI